MVCNTQPLALTLLILFAFAAPAPALAQQTADTTRVRTREVNVDVWVEDQRTGAPVVGLTRENFEIRDQGKRRTLAHFSRAGDLRTRPLALVLLLDLWPNGVGQFLRQPGFVESLTAALNKLPPEDEVAVLATSVEGVRGKQQWLTELTRDRAKITAALASVPSLVGDKQIQQKEYANSFGEVVEHVARLATERPESQVVLVEISDGMNSLDAIHLRDRERMLANLLRGNVIFSALTYDLSGKKKALVAASKPLFVLTRTSVTGNEQHFAKATGGEALTVDTAEEYAKGLERIVGTLTARYSLGFTLAPGDLDDGKLRRLDIKVTALDSHGKKRNLQVRARRGYYVPKTN